MMMATGYEAPELAAGRQLSPRAAAAADVYSFGVLLLEMLTGRVPAASLRDDGLELPRWVQSVVREEWTAEVFDLELLALAKEREPEMVALLQAAMACCDPDPLQRPAMDHVVAMIDAAVVSGELHQHHHHQHQHQHHQHHPHQHQHHPHQHQLHHQSPIPLRDHCSTIHEDEDQGHGTSSSSSSSSSSPQSIQPLPLA
jgi:hypothetical protein